MKLDRTDRRILQAMQRNARISNLELAEAVGLSPTPCSRRVKRLEASGIIRAHVTLLDQSKLGLKLTAYISISMDRHTPERFEAFEAEVRQYPEVMECSVVTGPSFPTWNTTRNSCSGSLPASTASAACIPASNCDG